MVAVVNDDDIARREGPGEFRLDIGQKGIGVDRPFEDSRRIHPIVAERCDEGHRSPMAMRDMGDKTPAAFAPAPERSHVGLHPGLVDEHQAGDADPALVGLPARPSSGHVRPGLLLGQQGFF